MNPNVDFYRSGINQARLPEIQRYETGGINNYQTGLPLSQTSSLQSSRSIPSVAPPQMNPMISGYQTNQPFPANVMPPPSSMQGNGPMSGLNPLGNFNLNSTVGMHPGGLQQPGFLNANNASLGMAPSIHGGPAIQHIAPYGMQPAGSGHQMPNLPSSGSIIGANQMGNNPLNNPGMLNTNLSSASSLSSSKSFTQSGLNHPHGQGNIYPTPPNQIFAPPGGPQVSGIPNFSTNAPQSHPKPVINPTLPNNNPIANFTSQAPINLPKASVNFPNQVPFAPKNLPGNDSIINQPRIPIPPTNFPGSSPVANNIPMPVPSANLPSSNFLPNIPVPSSNLPENNFLPKNIPVPPANFLGNNLIASKIPVPPANNIPVLPSNLQFPLNMPGGIMPSGPNLQGAQFPIPPVVPKLPNGAPTAMNFPLPQANPSFVSRNPQNSNLSSSSSESSIEIKRVSVDANLLQNAQQSGHFIKIKNEFPKVNLYSDSAGIGQDFINVQGPKADVKTVSGMISSLQIDRDTHWRFLKDDGNFEKYDSSKSGVIEKSFSNFNESCEIDIGTQQFVIIFGTNGNPHTQINTSGNKTIHRTVRRGPDPDVNKFTENDIIWYWSDEISNKMKKYEPEACKAIELFYTKFLKKNQGVNIRSKTKEQFEAFILESSVLVWGKSGFSYMIDFANMVQINEKTRRWRGISRGNPNGPLRVSQLPPEPIPYIPHPDLD